MTDIKCAALRQSMFAITSVIALTALVPVHAEEIETSTSAAAPERDLLSEVVVTARRREERLQDVPVAVSVIGGSELKDKGIVRLEDVSRAVPALQIESESYGRNVPSFTIRSQRQATNLITQDTSVAVYFADVPQARAQGLNGAMFDLASIQVLKGPQGTLFGRNTTGGAVVITPQRPTNSFEGYLTADFGNLNQRSVEGAVNLPVNDSLQVRAGGQIDRREGYIHNVYDGSDLDDDHNESWRLSIRFKPIEDLTNDLVVNGFNAHDHGEGGVLRSIGPVAIPSIAAALAQEYAATKVRGRYTENSNDPHGTQISTIGLSNITQWQLDDVTLKNIFGVRNVDSHLRLDHDASPVTILAGRDDMVETQYSDEAQVLGQALDKHLDYIAGVFYFEESGDMNGGNNIFGNPRNLTGHARNESKSVFGQTTYHLPFADTVSLTGGLRETWDTREFTYNGTSGVVPVCLFTVNDVPLSSGGVLLDPCGFTRQADYSNLTYTVTADWKITSDALLYAAHRKGYRAGGFNPRATSISQTDPFNPEQVKDYEVGLKTEWHPGRIAVRFNIDGYHQDYDDIQRNQNRVDANGTFIGSTVTNAASATIDGFEMELDVRPLRGLQLNAFYSYSHAKYNKWLSPQLVSGGIVYIDESSSPFAAAPDHSGGGSIAYTLPLSQSVGAVTVSSNIYSQSETWGSDGNYTPTLRASARLPGYSLINARVEWADLVGTHLTVAGYVHNLTDKYYFPSGVDTSNAGLGTNFGLVGAPRTYGAELTYRF
jgi:iron complex outermembrane receptor protein